MPATLSSSPPALQEATKNSTTVWQSHLESLFRSAKDRFPDVVWELTADDDEDVDMQTQGAREQVWGHKAIIYARAPPSFQSRYFSFRPNNAVIPPYSSSPTNTLPTTSALSLDISVALISRTPSPLRSSSPAPSATTTVVHPAPGPLLRLRTSINPTLFSNELEYLYTGQGLGQAFEFLFDSLEMPPDPVDAEELRIDKLRKDLVFMWRSRLYSDVRIALTGNFSSSNHESTTAIFSTHRFILVSRSPYFNTALISWPSPSTKQQQQQQSNEPITVTLPSPPFTPASLHFTLGFMYTGTLVFSHRSYDLDTAFHILRAAIYLCLTTLYDEIQARIVQEMMHGLFHAFLPFPEYERLTHSAWGVGGCRCRQCARRAPRVLEFATASDVRNEFLERGARRALVGLFGEGWCTQEFAGLNQKIKETVLRGLAKRTTPSNVWPLLFAAEHALGRLTNVIDAWTEGVREMVITARKAIDEAICAKSEECFAQGEWEDLMQNDGARFGDDERVEWSMAAVSRGLTEKNAAVVYQTLVSSILLRPHPAEHNAPMLSSTSHIRLQVEQARVDLIRWIGKRWIGIRQENGFEELEGWALKEISDNIEVPVEDLLTPVPASRASLHPKSNANTSGQHLLRASTRDADSANDSISMHSSMRVSVLSRNLPRRGTTPTQSVASSVCSGVSGSSQADKRGVKRVTLTPRRGGRTGDEDALSQTREPEAGEEEEEEEEEEGEDVKPEEGGRPDSKLTPGLSSIGLPEFGAVGREDSTSPTPPPSIVEPQGQDEIQQDEEGEQEEKDERDRTPQPEGDSKQRTPIQKVLVRRIDPSAFPSRRSVASTATTSSSAAAMRPKSSASSIRSSASFKSSASSIRSTATTRTQTSTPRRRPTTPSNTSSSSLRPPASQPSTRSASRGSTTSASAPRPSSSVSNTSDGTGTFHTANSRRSSVSTLVLHGRGGSRPRTASSSPGTTTATSGSGGAAVTAATTRSRKTSTGSVKSLRSPVGSTPTKRPPPVPAVDPARLSQAVPGKRPSSIAPSVRSTVTVVGARKSVASSSSATGVSRKTSGTEKKVLVASNGNAQSEDHVDLTASNRPAKGKHRTTASASPSTSSQNDHKKSGSTTSTGSIATLKQCRGSTDTITKTSSKQSSPPSVPSVKFKLKPATAVPVTTELLPFAPRGATLDIGIPCIISSKRKRFKAYARYIGEVEGELGPWVGVEVPVSESWAGDRGDDGGRQWNDGTWGGIRYFEIGSAVGSEWEYGGGYGDDRAVRRRRMEGGGQSGSYGAGGKGLLKREGDQLNVERAKRIRSVSPSVSETSGMESRGLFVRPQQVLYVVDAVGSDL